jgi:shikimate kinase
MSDHRDGKEGVLSTQYSVVRTQQSANRSVIFQNSSLIVFLIGYRGTGKSTVARLLAQHLGWKWLDADAVLEARSGRTIADIFAHEGEPAFRDLEAEVLAELCTRSGCVIATGGGVVLREANRQRMRRAGRVIWLTANAETIWARLQADAAVGNVRPSLTVGGRAEVQQLLQVREPLYRAAADKIIETGGRTPEEVAQEILRHITR